MQMACSCRLLLLLLRPLRLLLLDLATDLDSRSRCWGSLKDTADPRESVPAAIPACGCCWGWAIGADLMLAMLLLDC